MKFYAVILSVVSVGAYVQAAAVTVPTELMPGKCPPGIAKAGENKGFHGDSKGHFHLSQLALKQQSLQF
jgi:hypothetical protein